MRKKGENPCEGKGEKGGSHRLNWEGTLREGRGRERNSTDRIAFAGLHRGVATDIDGGRAKEGQEAEGGRKREREKIAGEKGGTRRHRLDR